MWSMSDALNTAESNVAPWDTLAKSEKTLASRPIGQLDGKEGGTGCDVSECVRVSCKYHVTHTADKPKQPNIPTQASRPQKATRGRQGGLVGGWLVHKVENLNLPLRCQH